MTYTAEQVRQAISDQPHFRDAQEELVYQMLEAFAERLEQEQGPMSLDPNALVRQAREDGKREAREEIRQQLLDTIQALPQTFQDALHFAKTGKRKRR